MKKFIHKLNLLGWTLEFEDSDTEKYSFSKGKGMFNILFEFQDDDFVTVSTVIPVPQDVEDYATLERMLMPYIKKELEEKNQFEWDGNLWESIKLFEYYVLPHDESVTNWNEVDIAIVEDMISDHMSYVRRMKSTLTRLYKKLYQWQEQHHLEPEHAIRLPLGRIHSAYPTLKDALDQYVNYMKTSRINEDEQEIIGDFCFWIADIAIYNLCYRNLLRERGVNALIQQICKDEPRLDKDIVKKNILQKWEEMGKKLPDYDIRYVGLREKVDILGEDFTGLDDFLEKNSSLNVFYTSHPYPCFDEFDAMYEDRSYKAWAFSRDPITDQVCQELGSIVSMPIMWDRHNFDPKHLPVVYDNGDKPVAYLVTPH